MLKITNDFHRTSTRIRKSVGDVVTEQYVRQIANKLCGGDCTCGGIRHSAIDFEQINEYGDCRIVDRTVDDDNQQWY